MSAIRVFALFLLISTLALGLVSCAGHGSLGTRRGRLSVTVRWPATRDIPPATRSLEITVSTLVTKNGSKVEDVPVGQTVVTRPEGQSTRTITLENLPSVEVRVKVRAFASMDGTGSPLAAGQKDVVIGEHQTTSVDITLQSSGPPSEVVINPQTKLTGICFETRMFTATVTGLGDKRVTWSLPTGGVITAQDPPDSSGVSSVEIEPGKMTGSFTITATSVADPTKSGTATMVVDLAYGSSWNGGVFIIGDPDEQNRYDVVDRNRQNGWLVTRSGSSFSGPQTQGGTGTLSFTIGGNTITGSVTKGGQTTPFSFSRDVFCEAQ